MYRTARGRVVQRQGATQVGGYSVRRCNLGVELLAETSGTFTALTSAERVNVSRFPGGINTFPHGSVTATAWLQILVRE